MPTIVSVIVPPIDKALDYLVPKELKDVVDVGFEVEVPLGTRKAKAFVISKVTVQPPLNAEIKDTILLANDSTDQLITRFEESCASHNYLIGQQNRGLHREEAERVLSKSRKAKVSNKFKLKPLIKISQAGQCFNEEQLQLFKWMAQYYGEDLGTVINTAIPEPAPKKFLKFASLLENPDVCIRGKVQQEIIALLSSQNEPLNLNAITHHIKTATTPLRRLESLGIVRIQSEEILDQYLSDELAPDWAKRDVVLNEAQRKSFDSIVSSINEKRFETFMLHGITGSGKTEVYIEAIRHAASLGLGALIIVPEIALTPQLIDRFKARLGNNIAILHSALSKRARWDAWRALLAGRSTIALGARSGVFAPIRNLGIIIVDEEHDQSYKQSESLRYNARDLSIMRGHTSKCPVVLGSATPSLESYQNARENKYTLLDLPYRHSISMPPAAEIVDLNLIKPWEMTSKNISPKLFKAVKETLQDQAQVFILYNRRGFASYLQCEKCGAALECPSCSVTLTYHKNTNLVVCHYCNHSGRPPEKCVQCKDQENPGGLAHRGAGTEKVVDELKALFPITEIERLDRDAVENLSHYRSILSRVRDGQTQVLVGTQMIAKGHDLPNVTLVGVIDCDVGLHFPDFRASERAFQLLTQAAGRAGRGGKAGRVILQTRMPKHPSLIKTLQDDFKGFAEIELRQRKALRYPPFYRLLRVIASSPDKDRPPYALLQLKEALMVYRGDHKVDVIILGPAPAPLEKLKTQWRWHLLLKSQSSVALHQALNVFRAVKIKRKNLRLVYDIDPQDMM